MPRGFLVCPGCQSPIREGQPMAEVRWGTLAEGAFDPDPTAEPELVCYACAEEATSFHSRMQGRP